MPVALVAKFKSIGGNLVMLLHSEPLLVAVRRARDILLRPPPGNQSDGEIALRMELSALLCTPLIDEIERTYFPGACTDRLQKMQPDAAS